MKIDNTHQNTNNRLNDLKKTHSYYLIASILIGFFLIGLIINFIISPTQGTSLQCLFSFILGVILVWLINMMELKNKEIRQIEIGSGERNSYTKKYVDGDLLIEYSEFRAPEMSDEEKYYSEVLCFAFWENNKTLGQGLNSIVEFLDEVGFPLNSGIEVASNQLRYLRPENRFINIGLIGNKLPPFILHKSFPDEWVLPKSIAGTEKKDLILGVYTSLDDLCELVKRCGFIIVEEEPQTELKNQSRERIPDDVQIFVWRRDEGRCVKCGSQEKLEFDHIIPLSQGGSNTARNIQLLCESCNRAKGNKIGN